MFGIGMPEMILIFAVAIIVIGPKKLPDLARSLGKAFGEFKQATNDLKDSFEIDSHISDVSKPFDDVASEVKESLDSPPGEDDVEGTRQPGTGPEEDENASPTAPKDAEESEKTALSPRESTAVSGAAGDSAAVEDDENPLSTPTEETTAPPREETAADKEDKPTQSETNSAEEAKRGTPQQ